MFENQDSTEKYYVKKNNHDMQIFNIEFYFICNLMVEVPGCKTTL